MESIQRIIKPILNILWFIFGGMLGGLGWLLGGVLMCITIIGIPLGVQCFKFAEMTFFPFGKHIEYGGSTTSLLVNIIWIVLCGWELALGFVTMSVPYFVSIIGIPFGIQCLKLAQLSLMPFGAVIVYDAD